MSDLSARLESLSREERAALIKLLRQKKEAASAPPPPREARRDLPLSFAQQRLWFLDRLAPGNPVYNVPVVLRLIGRLDVAVLAACLSEIVRRHASLRTRFEIRGDGPVQIIEPPAPLSLPVVDVSALPVEIRVPEERRIAFERENAPFDLSRPPLLRACLVRLGTEEHLLIHVFHHIASDGWSVEVAVGEVAALYPAFLAGRPSPLPELPLQYADFAWQQIQTLQGATLAREIGFWRERLAGASPLELPTDRTRPAIPSFRGNTLEVILPATLEAGLRQLAREQRATPFMALLAPLCAFLSRIANTDDVVLGTVVAGRDRRDIAELIGFFVNTLILRIDLSGDPDGLALLAQARQVALEAFDHQALPFEKLVDELGLPRNPYRPPLLRVLYQLLPIGRTSDDLPGLTLERFSLPVETAKFDLVVNAGALPDGLRLKWRYDADLFDASTISRWSGMLEVLVGGWLEDPARRVSELPLLTEIERLQLLTGWSPAPFTADRADRGRWALPALFEAQVHRTPEAPAVSAEADAGLTYRELDERANRLARWLVDAGVVPGDRVALCLDRSPDLVVSLLGVLKTGAAYVPLDPSSPRERLAFALEDSGASLLLDTALLEREADDVARRSGDRLGLDLDPELPAYVIYTSGSTGSPKGVIVPHGAVSRLFAATAPWLDFGPDDVWTLFHSYAFDFSVWEIWGALLHGGRLVVVPYPVSRDPAAFSRLLREERVTVLNQTPSAFRQLIRAEERQEADLSLRLVIFGGEALDPTMLEPWFSRLGDERPRLVNMYGITETTVHVTHRPLTREDAARPASRIGQPIPDLTVHVLDRHLQLQPVGVPGEICVGGEGLAHGYLGRPDLTAARFVPDPFGDRSGGGGSRLYRSGDLARRRPDGDLEFLGRIDHQVKIRGFRIEPGEIETALTAHPAVREAVVLARQDGSGEPRLVAYCTAEPQGAPSFAELRDFLAGQLPDFMLPSALVVLDRLPLTANGKVDRRALPAPGTAPAAASDRRQVPPRDALEAGLTGLVRRVLNVPAEREIGILDNFFDLGGSSISGAVLINLLQEILGEIVHVVVIFDHPTVESLASYVREQHAAAAARLWSTAAPAEPVAERPAGPAAGPVELAEMLRLIEEGRPEADFQESLEPLNPPAVFILSPPRSGSTLLRVMLGAHPRLFAPPELELLSFQTLAGRHAAFSGRDGFWLEGAVRAVMEARSCDAAEAARIVAAGEREGWTTRRFYRELQGWIGDRLLVDKTPSYALDPAVLRRAEGWFAGARYLHLVRHPQATIRSFEEARLDQIFFRRPHLFSRRQLAELIWTVSHRHILDFLAEVPAERRHTVRFEELVRAPERVLTAICDFLGVELDPAMVDPYRGGAARMTGGVHAVSRMLGDVKLLSHGKVDASVADRWKQAEVAPLGAPAGAVATELGYSSTAPAAPPALTSRGAWEEGGTAPASFAQERLWLIEQLMPGTSTYNVPGGFRLHGRLDVPAFARAFHEIVRRHAALRTVFVSESGRPIQKIEPALDRSRARSLPVIDLAALPGEARDAEVERVAAAEAALPFDLERGPLIRASLLHLGPREHVAVYTMHHIVSDGWSMGVFYREVATLYEAFAAGRPSPLPELRLQYPDYALRQRSRSGEGEEGLAQELAWWKERLAGLEPLELPTDRPRPAVRSGRGSQAVLQFRPGLSEELTALGRGERATLYMVLLAAFQGFLQRLARQDDIAVGSPVAHRLTRDVEELIGFFVNTLVMRTELSGDPTFRELLVRVRGTALGAMLHQEAPFERVVEAVQPERQLSRSPLFQVMFTLQNAISGSVELPGLILEEAHPPMVTAKFDLTLMFAEGPDGIGSSLEYDLDLFEPATAERMLRHLQNLLEGAAASPDTRLSDLPLLTPQERSALVTAWNGVPASGAPYRRALPRRFEEQVDRTPDAPAVSLGGEHLTYRALDDRAEALARHLRARGVLPGDRVALCFDRSLAMIVAILGVLKAGAAYVPLDPAWPLERVAFALEDSGAVLVLTTEAQAEALPATVNRAVLMDREVPAAGRPGGRRLGLPLDPELPAYVIYTSGSTGRPKGVVVPHGNVTRLFGSTERWFSFGREDVWTLFHSYAFDFSVWEIWGALLYGGRLVVVPYWVSREPEAFWQLLCEERVTVLNQTPSAFRQLLWAEGGPGAEPTLRFVIFGGEALDPSMLAPWFTGLSPGGDERPRLVNMYGITETTVHVTFRPLTHRDARRPGSRVGEPIPDLTVYVLDRALEPQPLGVPGEICVGGQGLAHGYLDRPDLTAGRFVPDPFGPAGARLYRSGDLARRLPDGDLEYLGRIDFQVKIRGFRVELGEIESALAAHPQIRDAAVLVRQEDGDKRLVAYVAAGEPSPPDPLSQPHSRPPGRGGTSDGSDGSDRSVGSDDLRRWLAGHLPESMIPSAFVVLPRLPLTPNGKVDRRELARIAPERSATGYVAPRTPVEEVLAGLFAEVLGEERTGGRLGIHDNFFELGGHSLAAARLVSRVRAELGIELPLRALFEAPTVAGLAARCATSAGEPLSVPQERPARLESLSREERAALVGLLRQKKEAAADHEPLVRRERDPSGMPLSSSQERLWFLARLDPGTSTYNLPSRARLRGPLDPARLALCFTEVVRRHEALRTRFALRDGAPVQVVDPPVPFVLPLVDLSGLPDGLRGPAAERLAGEEADWPFDLERGPLVRAVLLRLGDAEHGLLVNLHHIITDGWSMGILFRELAVLYAALTEGRPSTLPELPVQVADVARWQRERLAGPALEAQLAYWRERLGGAPAALDLPLDRTRPAMQTFRGDSVPWLLPAELAGRLRDLARREGASVFMVLLAGLDLLLARQSGQDDVLVGTPVAGRNHPALENLIGCFLNTLVLRVDLSGRPTGRALVGRAREVAFGAYAHQDVPFEKLLQDLQPERDLSRTPLFQVFLNMLNFPDSGARLPDGLVLEPLGGTGVDSKFDLTLYAAEGETGISLSLVYNADLFDRARMEELVRQLQSVLDQLAAAPEAPVEAISLLTPEAAALLPDPRQPLGDAWAGSVHSLFAEQARRQPERPAVSDADGTWTYGELAEAVSRLAARLRADGLAPGEPVAIWAHRSAPVAWAMMTTAWAGGAFVMLDPAYPPERLVTILELAAPRYWLELAAAGVPPAEVEEALRRLAAAGTLRGRAILPGGGPAGARAFVETLPAPVEPAAAGPDDLAYVAFTSGSTGTPKGIEGRHGPLSHFLPFLQERFRLTNEDRTSLLSGLSHDPLQRDVFTPLCLGAALAAPTFDEVSTPGRLAAWMAREGITIAHLTPAMAQLLTETGAGPAPSITTLRWVLLVGDVLTRLDVDRLRRIAPRVTCVNLYGSTETQRSVAFHVVEESEVADARAPQVLPLGRGMRDVQLLVVSRGTDPQPRLAGIGEVGEIWMRGPHLARGYLGDAALTAERFRENPFLDPTDRSDRIYRTGDLGRYRLDGEATFAGRADLQVKIRGFRIELGEIEAALGRLPGVREAVVLARSVPHETPDRPGDRELVAYLAGDGLDPARLREDLRSRLPGYMVPAAFVLLDELPVTPNGKVDRSALSRTAPERGTEGYVAPCTPAEEALAALWVEVLGGQRTGGRVGGRDNFFGLGGHSLLATRLVAAVREAFDVELPLRTVFERPTLAEMAAAIADAGEAGPALDEPVARLPREPGVNHFPVSFSQLREWILDRLEPGNPAYNIPNNLRIGGPLSIPVLAEALRRLVQRHEVFRTAFAAGDDEPLQVVLPEVTLQVPVIDLSALPEEAREEELWRRVRHQAGTGFDLTAAPLLRIRVVRLDAEDHALLMTVHHIISDGWSMGILNQELAALYEAAAAGTQSPLPPLPVQYADYAVWLRRRLDAETLERQVGYWRQRLTGAPPLLELPADRPRPPVRSSRGVRLPFFLPQPLAGRLEELALRHGSSLFMVLLAGYQTLLARWSGQDDVVAGTYSGNRPRRELETLIGFFINTLVLRTDLSDDPSFSTLLGRVRETTLGAYAHRDVPFEKLLEALQLPRDPSRTPLFQALLVLHNFPPARADLSMGVRLAALPVAVEKSDYDLSLWLGEGPDGLGGALEYSTDLFDESTIVRFARQLRVLLEAAVADPARNVWALPLIGEEEQASQLEAWSRGPAVPEGPPLLHRLVEEQAARTPTAVAVEAGGVRLTYAELVEQASRRAHRLDEEGVGPGSIVALAAERTPELIVSLLAVLQAGAAYLPLDPAYPQERREYMVADSGAVNPHPLTPSPKGEGETDPVPASPLPWERGLGGEGPGEAGFVGQPDLPAYVIYTSGSTGRPKGVVVPHRAIASFVRAARETYEIGPGDRMLQFASISFDTSAEEIWPALAAGATLVLRPQEMAASIPHFLRELERLGITHLDLPTAFWHEMAAGLEAEGLELPRGLRLVILGGEEALADRFALWHRRVGSSVRLVNTYGPTETTIVATRRELTDLAPGGTVPIGRPIPGARTYVLDRFFVPVPPGVRGELWIGGAGVARGYLGRPDLTAERFIPDPFSEDLGARLYRTGDLAVLRPDGDLVFAGRADRQLKIRGYRIEPGEIEAVLRLHPALRDAVVDTRGARDDRRLIAWIMPHEGIEAPGASDLRAFLRERVPEPLLPAAFVPVEALPLTPSGKVDRRALPEPAEGRSENAAYAEPQSALERTIAEIYRGLLRVGRVGLHDNFFDLGGHSLLIVRAHQQLREALGKEIPVLDLFRFPTVAALARHLEGEETGTLQKVQGFAEQQRVAQQRQKAAMERLRRPARK